MSEIISIILNTAWLVELLKLVACVLAVLVVSCVKAIIKAVYKKQNKSFDAKKFEYLFFIIAFLIAGTAAFLIAYLLQHNTLISSFEDAGIYGSATQALYYIIIQPSRKGINWIIKAIGKFIAYIKTKKVTSKDIKDVVKSINTVSSVDTFFSEINK